jgi:hypothetical protein
MEWIKKQFDRLLCAFCWSLGSLVAFAAFIAILWLMWLLVRCQFPNAIRAFVLVLSPQAITLPPEKMQTLLELVKAGYIMPLADLINVVSGFYNTIIVVLVTLITVIGFASYLYVGRLSKDHAERLVGDTISKTLENPEYLYNTFTKQDEFSQILKSFEKIDSLESAITTLSHAVNNKNGKGTAAKSASAKKTTAKTKAKKTKR